MRKLRKIIVNHSEYKWLFRYDDYDYQKIPYILIIKSALPETTLHIRFPVKEHFLLNSGLPAIFQGNPVSINLNQPFFIAQIIQWCENQKDLLHQTDNQYLNGIDLLKEMGYEIERPFIS